MFWEDDWDRVLKHSWNMDNDFTGDHVAMVNDLLGDEGVGEVCFRIKIM